MSHRTGGPDSLGGPIFAVYIGLLIALISGSQVHTVVAQDLPKGPKLVVKASNFDFGTVAEGTKVEHEYLVRNEGEVDLNIQRVIAACGCTATNVSASAIAPGAETKIQVAFDSSGFSGAVQKAVRIYSDDPKNPITVLSVSGSVSPEVKIEPKAVNFGGIVRDKVGDAVKEVSISIDNSSKAQIALIRSFSKFVKIEELESGEKKRRIALRLAPEIATGEFRDRLIVELKGGRQSTVNVPIFANVKGLYSIEPPVLSFGLITGNEPITRRAKFAISSQGEFRLDSVEPNHPAISASITAINGERSYWIDVTLNPSKVEKDLRASVKLLTSGPAAPEGLSLNVYGVLPPKVGG